jgi:hypothetical protein
MLDEAGKIWTLILIVQNNMNSACPSRLFLSLLPLFSSLHHHDHKNQMISFGRNDDR